LTLGCASLAAQYSTPQEEMKGDSVLNCWREVVVFGHVEKASKYLTADYAEHNPNVSGGRDGFIEYYGRTPARPIQPALPKPPVMTFGKGDYVVLVWEHDDQDATGKAIQYDTFDVFRIQKGKIQEHWDGEAKRN
jgi:predicted SnoaL-like aldol condensation-catalyzing enzyme